MAILKTLMLSYYIGRSVIKYTLYKQYLNAPFYMNLHIYTCICTMTVHYKYTYKLVVIL